MKSKDLALGDIVVCGDFLSWWSYGEVVRIMPGNIDIMEPNGRISAWSPKFGRFQRCPSTEVAEQILANENSV